MEKTKIIPVTQAESIETPIQLTRRGRLLLKAGKIAGVAAGVALTVGGIGAAVEANTSHFHGSQTEVVDNEHTVTDLAEEVEGHEGHVNDTIDKIVEMNPDVFQDGKAFIGSEDMGKTVKLPKSVD